ncbi:MAG TPA: zinc metallopeptidase [Verrucomicrobiae bacterium]|nr:zinc metallopeptidase [Verrucomicrobiae bacterium]
MNLAGIWILLLVLILVPGIVAQMRVRAAIRKYSQVRARSGRTGAEAAEEILDGAGIHDVHIERTDSFLGDHYDPRTKTLVLSPAVYDSDSIAALGIAAHESGHAIQHQHAYAPLQVRMAVVPVTMFTSQLLPLVIIGGFFFRITQFITLGIIIYTVIVFFQLITLPVEFNASSRAKLILQQSGLVTRDEMPGVRRVLNAAALTYVAALIAAAAQLLQLILLSRDRR